MRKYLAIAGGAITNVLLVGAAYAQVGTGEVTPIEPVRTDITPRDILTSVINIALLLGGALAVIYLIYSGVIYITAGGDAEKAGKGRTGIINAVIGIIIIALAFAIFRYISGTFAGSIQGGQPNL